MSLFFLLPKGGLNAVVTVSGQTVIEVGSEPSAGVRFNTDGTVDSYTNENGSSPTYSQIDASTDWIVPNSAASDKTYHVRATLNSESGGGTKTGPLGVWLELNTNLLWFIERLSGAGSGTSEWDLDIEISDDGGTTTLDTALYQLSATIL